MGLCVCLFVYQHHRDSPTNPRSPYMLIGRINNTIDTAMADVDGLLAQVRPPVAAAA